MLHIVVWGPDGVTPDRGPAIVGPGYWHASRSKDEAYLWETLYGPPLAVASGYDFDIIVRSHALQPDDDTWLGPDANRPA